MIANRNVLWGRAVVQALVRAGIRHVSLAPGSRSTPLVLAVGDEPHLDVVTHWDERSAAFFALGVAKATRTPAAVITTSGTAVAELLPATVEANLARIPLVLITADRPPELHEVGANQTIDQHDIFGRHVRRFIDVGLPEPRRERLLHLWTMIEGAVATSRGPRPGPVHINLPFREPLEPREVPGDVPADLDTTPPGGIPRRPAAIAPLADADVAGLADLISKSPRGLVVVGPIDADARAAEAVAALARRTGFPILADPLSGLRFHPALAEHVVTTYDLLLTEPSVRQAHPQVVVRIGPSPVSKHLIAFLRELRDATQICFVPPGQRGEETHLAAATHDSDPAAALEAVIPHLTLKRDPSWLAQWRSWDATAHGVIRTELAGRAFEGQLANRLVEALPDDSVLFVSNSLPIRDVDRFSPKRRGALRILANRGASGIDGVLSTALGVAEASERPTTLLIGDQAFLHDLNALATLRHRRSTLHVVLVNNNGGGIFQFLPIADYDPPFTERFVAPHGLDLGRIASAFDIPARSLHVGEADTGAIRRFLEGPAGLLEIRSDRRENVTHRRAIEAALSRELSTARPEVRHAR